MEEDLPGAAKVIADLEAMGISMDEVTYELEVDGVKSFADALTVLLDAIKAKMPCPCSSRNVAQISNLRSEMKFRSTPTKTCQM